MRTQIEIWKDIPEFEMYEVSNLGRVRRKALVLTPGSIPSGHLTVALCRGRGNGKPKSVYVHRLVAAAFAENEMGHPVVNHKNGNPKDNHIDNLEWCTYSHNIAHGYRNNGRRNPRERAVHSISEDGEIVATYRSIAIAARQLNVTPHAIRSAAIRGGASCGYFWKFV